MIIAQLFQAFGKNACKWLRGNMINPIVKPTSYVWELHPRDVSEGKEPPGRFRQSIGQFREEALVVRTCEALGHGGHGEWRLHGAVMTGQMGWV